MKILILAEYKIYNQPFSVEIDWFWLNIKFIAGQKLSDNYGFLRLTDFYSRLNRIHRCSQASTNYIPHITPLYNLLTNSFPPNTHQASFAL